MEQVTIIISRDVIDYLEDLVFILRDKGYFNFLEDAEEYVNRLYDAIPVAIQKQRHKQTPEELIKNGRFYVSYNTANRTTWYIFFARTDDRIFVKFVTNNHVYNAGFLNSND